MFSFSAGTGGGFSYDRLGARQPPCGRPSSWSVSSPAGYWYPASVASWGGAFGVRLGPGRTIVGRFGYGDAGLLVRPDLYTDCLATRRLYLVGLFDGRVFTRCRCAGPGCQRFVSTTCGSYYSCSCGCVPAELPLPHRRVHVCSLHLRALVITHLRSGGSPVSAVACSHAGGVRCSAAQPDKVACSPYARPQHHLR